MEKAFTSRDSQGKVMGDVLAFCISAHADAFPLQVQRLLQLRVLSGHASSRGLVPHVVRAHGPPLPRHAASLSKGCYAPTPPSCPSQRVGQWAAWTLLR